MRVFALLAALLLPTLGHADKPGIDITWLGHATFLVTSPSGQTTLLIDPFIRQNPSTPAARKKIDDYKPTAILVTHSHFDHAADAVDIAKASGAKVIGVAMYVSKLELPDAQKLGGNVGGEIAVGDVKVHFVPAMHGSEPSGRPLGFVIEFADGRRLYHTGDTWIFGDMALIQEIHHPNIILLQAGGGPYNQNPTVARLAIEKYFKPDVVVPMHFGTWPVLADDATVRKAFEGFAKAHFMTPGTTERF